LKGFQVKAQSIKPENFPGWEGGLALALLRLERQRHLER
jgi:hypothetical protein